MEEIDLQDICDFLVMLAKEGGQLILNANPSSFDNAPKKNSMVQELFLNSSC